MSWFLWFFFTAIFLYFLRNLYLPEAVALYGKYARRGPWYWEKRGIFLLLLKLRKYRAEKDDAKASEGGAGYGVKSKSDVKDMDCAQKLESTPKAVDAVYFNGSNEDGAYIVTALSRRPKNVAQMVLFVKLPGGDLFQLPEHPDSTVYNCNPDEHDAGGLKLECVTPMKQWKITYNGKLRKGPRDEWKDDEEGLVDAKFDFTWTAYTEYYDFDVDQHPATISDAVAKEQWSREFFKTLKDAHQTHYEQFGEWIGTVEINGQKKIDLTMRGMRDHSYGKRREWGDFHRYGIHMVHLADGTSINLGKICIPGMLSDLSIGYVMNGSGKKDAISSTTMSLPELGEDGIPTKNYEVSFVAGEENYKMQVEVLHAPIFYMGFDWEAKIFEQMIKVNVNGQKGYGIAEFLYRWYLGSPRTAEEKFD
ncbi:uncharacterized protein LOC144448454 [Glandiceps talaboti]